MQSLQQKLMAQVPQKLSFGDTEQIKKLSRIRELAPGSFQFTARYLLSLSCYVETSLDIWAASAEEAYNIANSEKFFDEAFQQASDEILEWDVDRTDLLSVTPVTPLPPSPKSQLPLLQVKPNYRPQLKDWR